jgi:hypothetical protein
LSQASGLNTSRGEGASCDHEVLVAVDDRGEGVVAGGEDGDTLPDGGDIEGVSFRFGVVEDGDAVNGSWRVDATEDLAGALSLGIRAGVAVPLISQRRRNRAASD